MIRAPEILLIAGPISSGKTRYCEKMAAETRAQGLRVAGILSPQRMENGQKVEITAVDLTTGEARVLAVRGPARIGSWSFFADTIAWGNEVLARAIPTDVLIVDELGPLEFERGEGWVQGLRAVDSGQFKRAILSVRPALVEKFLARWPHAKVVDPAELA